MKYKTEYIKYKNKTDSLIVFCYKLLETLKRCESVDKVIIEKSEIEFKNLLE